MAVTKIHSIKTSVARTLKYCMSKAEISSGVNCITNLDIATEQFQRTKERFGKSEEKVITRKGKQYKERVGYHAIQSFKPGEISAEKAHEIGVELAKRMWGDRYEVIVSTHTDREHIHNHFVVNSVSFIDGKKMHFPNNNNNNAMNKEMAEISDKLCMEHGLGTIIVEPSITCADYGKYLLENKSSIRDSVKKDIDNLFSYSIKDLDEFFLELEKIGYEVRLDRKYPAVKPPYTERFIRLQSLGKNYTLECLYKRIFDNTKNRTYKTGNRDYYFADDKWRIYIFGLKQPPGSLSNLIKHYQIFLNKYQDKPLVYSSPETRDSAERIKNYSQEIDLLKNHDIKNFEDLGTFRWQAQKQLTNYIKERNNLYIIKKEERSSEVIIQINKLSMQIRELRKEVQLARNIVKDVKNLRVVQEQKKGDFEQVENEKQKTEKKEQGKDDFNQKQLDKEI